MTDRLRFHPELAEEDAPPLPRWVTTVAFVLGIIIGVLICMAA